MKSQVIKLTKADLRWGGGERKSGSQAEEGGTESGISGIILINSLDGIKRKVLLIHQNSFFFF